MITEAAIASCGRAALIAYLLYGYYFLVLGVEGAGAK
jgi:hypothetical protein